MDYRAVENLPAPELKKLHAELVAAKAPEAEQRYVQARCDAKVRDEKMAVQGKRITELEGLWSAAVRDYDALRTAHAETSRLLAEANEEAEVAAAQHAALSGRLQKLEPESVRLAQALAVANQRLAAMGKRCDEAEAAAAHLKSLVDALRVEATREERIRLATEKVEAAAQRVADNVAAMEKRPWYKKLLG